MRVLLISNEQCLEAWEMLAKVLCSSPSYPVFLLGSSFVSLIEGSFYYELSFLVHVCVFVPLALYIWILGAFVLVDISTVLLSTTMEACFPSQFQLMPLIFMRILWVCLMQKFRFIFGWFKYQFHCHLNHLSKICWAKGTYHALDWFF